MSHVYDIFGRLKHRPRWLLVSILLNFLLMGFELGMDPMFREAAFYHLPAGATVQDSAVLAQMLDRQMPLRLAFLPVRNFFGWGVFALCLYYTALAFRPPEPLRIVQVFALELWAEVPLALGSYATLLREWLAPSGAARFVNAPPLSLLDVVPTAGSLEQVALLGALNLFAGLSLAVLTAGMVALCGFQTKKALLVVCWVWVASLAWNAGVLAALRDLLHLTL